MSRIICGNLNEFIAACAALLREGIVFQGNSETLTITLTGGY